MSPPRFYIPQLAQSASGWLEGPEAKHATQVLRLSIDDQLHIFDGQGGEAVARIVAVAKNRIQFEVVERPNHDRELTAELTLAIALPKGDRQRILIDAATELGVARFIPLRTHRGVAQPTDNALQRLERIVIEACKQCGRNRLMQVCDPRTLTELNSTDNSLIRASATDELDQVACQDKPLRVVAHPYDARGQRFALSHWLSGPKRPVTIAIGPEGGFTDDEVQHLIDHNWLAADLGPTILRVEIAAIAAVAQIAAWLRPPL